MGITFWFYNSLGLVKERWISSQISPPADVERHIVRRIRAKLDGHAYSVIEDQELYTVEQLIGTLKATFQLPKSSSHYKGQLANIYMRLVVRMLDYTERI